MVAHPLRTCLGCREVRDQECLVRYVRAPDGQLLVDYRAKLPGRGAYTCPQRSCLEKAVARRQFDRALRAPCRPVSAAELGEALTAAVSERLVSLLGMARKSSQLLSGSTQVLEALSHAERLAVVILADDISSGVAAKVLGKANGGGVPCLRFSTKTALGRMLGRDERSTLALLKGHLAATFLGEWQRYQAISSEYAGER